MTGGGDHSIGLDDEPVRARVLAALSHGPLTMPELVNRTGGNLLRVVNDLVADRLVEYVDDQRIARVPPREISDGRDVDAPPSETRQRIESPVRLTDEGPDAGHRFYITVMIGASYRVGDGPHEDSPSEPDVLPPVTVRAWNLPAALRKASELPLQAWCDEEGY